MNIEAEISKLHIERGDVLILKADALSLGDYENVFVKDIIEKGLGFKVPIIIMDKEATLESVSKEDLQNIIDGK